MRLKKITGRDVLKGFFCLMLFIILFFVNIDALEDKCVILRTFKMNVKWLENLVESYSPLFFTIIIVNIIVWSMAKFSISLNTISFAGFDISLKDSDKAVKNAIKNYLNTKRSLFVFKPEYDNICEVFDSYHCIYDFLRTQMLEFEGKQKTKSEVYVEVHKMIVDLNRFLTIYQSDYRRWFSHHERINGEQYISLEEFQKQYPRFEELIHEFSLLNDSMRKHAQFFDITILAWEYNIKESDESKSLVNRV